jgi:hypothetical protein
MSDLQQSDLRKAGDRWHFSQPNLGFRAKYVSIDKEGERSEHSMLYLSTCREGVVSQARKKFQETFTTKNRTGHRVWNFSFETGEDRIDLADSTVKGAGDTKLLINASMLTREEQAVFLQVTDYLVGNVCVLLNPDERDEGEWWRTDPDDCLTPDIAGNNCVSWNGSDNFFLHHPALLSLVTGLYRQALLLTQAGFGEEILGVVPREKVDKAMTTGSWRQALANCKKLRQWIEIYTPGGNHQINFPFPEGYWLRFMRLHQALRRHGYQKVFDQDFTAAWNLLAKNSNWSGMYNFWGYKKGDDSGDSRQSDRRQRLMKLGKPQERNSTSEGKPAPAAS